ncbi:hypothetical protein [Serratia proteamaculans]|uniref:hypothetical protein n=1 Tax=Serratia proteamaculans TaxID=28151 RepID=UPI0021BCFE4E|nr:hypothetical protein [Serratia proteamaculans]
MRCTKRVMSPSDDGSARGIIDRRLAEMGLERPCFGVVMQHPAPTQSQSFSPLIHPY